MGRTSKTPAGKAGASRDHLGRWSHSLSTLDAYRAQFLCLTYGIRPEVAAMLAAVAFSGGAA